MKEKIKYIIGTIWLALVMYFYYKNHSYYTDGFTGLGNWWPLWLAPILSYGIFLFYNWGKGENSIILRLSAKKISVSFLLGMLFVGNVGFMVLNPLMYMGPTAIYNNDGTVNLNPTEDELSSDARILRKSIVISAGNNFYDTAPENIKQYLVRASLFEIEKGLLWTFIKVYLPSLMFLFFSCALGARLHKIIRRNLEHEDSFERKLIELVLGLLTMTGIFLLTSFLNQFSILVNLSIIGAISILIRKELSYIWTGITKWNATLELPFSNLILPIGIFISTFLFIHLDANLSPMPRGWDGLNRYILIARDIAESGSGVKIGSPYAWELILAFFYQIDSKIALFWTSLPGILNFIIIWILCKKFTSSRNASLVIAFMLSMPMMSFYMADENKIDVAHWLLGSTVLLSLLKGIDFENKIRVKDYSYIWIAGILAGFAFTVKLTGILLIFGLIASFALVESGWLFASSIFMLSLAALVKMGGLNLGSDFISSADFNSKFLIFSIVTGLILAFAAAYKKKLSKLNIKHFIILCALIALPILPWLGKNLYEIETISINNLIQGATHSPSVDMQGIAGKCDVATGSYEEYDRYLGYNPNIIIRAAAIPWHLTMNDIGAVGAYVDIGFSFLGFVLFAVLFYKFADKRKNLLLFFAIIYGFFWLVRANGVIWYGFPLLTFAAIAMVLAFNELDKNAFGRFIILVSFLTWGILALNTRLNNFGNAVLLLNNAGKITYQDVQENIFPFADEIQNYLKEHEGLVYKVGTPYGFYIPGFFGRTYDDQLLDIFYCTFLSYDGNPVKIIQIFEKNNIKFLLYDTHTNTIGNDPKGSLVKKVNTITDFINKYLEIIVYDDVRGNHLIYIPTEAELLQKHPELLQE